MLETEKLDDLSRLLEEMTQPEISYPKFAPLLIMWRLLKYFLIGFLLTVIALFALVRWRQRLETTPPGFHDDLLAVYLLLVVLFLAIVTTLIFGFLYITWHRKQLVPYLFPSLKNTLHRDAKLITQLWTFDKATLVYGLLKYRHRWLSSEGRVAALVGDFRKLGLFPALAALFISAATLFKEDSNPFLSFLWDFLAIVAIFYLIVFVALLSRERPQQVIQLLEYAIQHADQYNTTPSDANHQYKNETLEESAFRR